MALLKCRHCGTEIDSNARKTRCPGCGQLFPFACAICSAPLRPPFPVFDDERYLNADNAPLCSEHFERQCPQCQKWFSADENPGYFLCRSCMYAQEEREPEPVGVYPEQDEGEMPEIESPVSVVTRKRTAPAPHPLDAILSAIVFVSVAAVVVILGWQIFSVVRTILSH